VLEPSGRDEPAQLAQSPPPESRPAQLPAPERVRGTVE